jgi:M6 family metalloprotease-like protein
MKQLFSFFIALFIAGNVMAAPFESLPYTITQPDGTRIECFVSGDEFFNWIHDQNGFPIIQGADKYYYYAVPANGVYVASEYRVGVINPASVGIQKMQIIDKELVRRRRKDLEIPEKPVLNPSKNQRNTLHTGTFNNLVIYIKFAGEEEIVTPRQVYDDRLNQPEGYSVKAYYWETSYNQLTINSTHYPPVENPETSNASYIDQHPRNYYEPYNATTNPNGYNGSTERRLREHQMLVNAVTWINENHAIPSDLNIDADGDGYVDNVCFMINGQSGAWADLLWAHRWALYTYNVFIHGKRVYDYTFQPENQVSVRTLSHELFHVLGAPDLYHYYNYTDIKPAGKWDIMNSGSGHMLTYMKWKYAQQYWISDIPEITQPGQYTVFPTTQQTNNCFKIASPYSSNEYFVVEYRKFEGSFESLLPNQGLLVYRINPNFNGNAQYDGVSVFDEVYVYRPGGTLQANGDPDIGTFSSNSGRTEINDQTNPRSFLSNGNNGGLNIFNVTSIGESISFSVSFGTELELTVIADPQQAGNPTGTGSYTLGTVVPLTPNTNDGWEFVAWTNRLGNLISLNASVNYTITTPDDTVKAVFREAASIHSINSQAILYPNPAENTLYVEALTEVKEFAIYNLTGQKLISMKPNSSKFQLDISGLSSGVYWVETLNSDNKTCYYNMIKQ